MVQVSVKKQKSLEHWGYLNYGFFTQKGTDNTVGKKATWSIRDHTKWPVHKIWSIRCTWVIHIQWQYTVSRV